MLDERTDAASPAPPDVIRLRPHHFLCMLTYGGRGYTPEFVTNLDRVVERIGGGAVIEVVAGADDICSPMLRCREHPDFHCDNDSIRWRDEQALAAVAPFLAEHAGGAALTGSRLRVDAELVATLRRHFRAGLIRAACAGCEWHPRCTEQAAGGFLSARLRVAGESAEPR